MKIMITAGGTTEKIDPVRGITNTATGTLGSLTAEEFVKQGGGRIEKIFYVCGKGSVVPALERMDVFMAEGAEDVQDILSDLLTAHTIDAVVHSMAVSDYCVESITTVESLSGWIANRIFHDKRDGFQSEGALAGYIAACMNENDRLLDNSQKIGSAIDDLILTMKRTPKLISLVKSLQPSAVLVGFKLLNGVERRQLLDAGYDLLRKNHCDMVLANDLRDIGGERHVGRLIFPDRSHVRFESKKEIAHGIVRNVLSLIDKEVCQP